MQGEIVNTRKLTTALCAVVVLMFATTLLAQDLKVAPAVHTNAVIPYVEISNANISIFTNLGPTTTNEYNAAAGGYYVAGSSAADTTEQWISIPFVNKGADHVTQIQAAIGYISGTKKVTLGIYTDNAGTTGTLLAQASTNKIPALGVCCQLVQVAIASTALAANTQYWVVASTDDTAAPDFEGAWQPSNNANTGGDEAQSGWFTFSNLWPGVAVKGTNP
jgi:hypothetical protein